jgi:hypothetical protein
MNEPINAASAAVGYVVGQAGGRVGAHAGRAGRAGLRTARQAAARVVWLADQMGGSRMIDAVAHSQVLARIIDVQLSRAVPAVLDQILATLEAEPERVRVLIRGQRESMVDEVVDQVRTGAASGDAKVDRLVDRVLRRTEQPAG